MESWDISSNASGSEKIKSKFADYINELNCVGVIDYLVYSELFDFSMQLLDEMYELGKKELLHKEFEI